MNVSGKHLVIIVAILSWGGVLGIGIYQSGLKERQQVEMENKLKQTEVDMEREKLLLERDKVQLEEVKEQEKERTQRSKVRSTWLPWN